MCSRRSPRSPAPRAESPRIALLALLAFAAGCERAEPPVAPPGSGGVVFESNWNTALGATDAAIRDINAPYGPWDQWNDGGDTIMAVVGGGPPGYANALRVQQRGGSATGWADVRKNPFIATGNTDYYVRFYLKTNDVNGTVQDHGLEPWINAPQYLDLVYLGKNEGPSGWGCHLAIGGNATDGHGGHYPVFNWFLVGQDAHPLSYNTWYRLEYWVHFTSTNHIQVHPRVYDAGGTLLYQDADFVQEDYLNTPCDWPGSAGLNDWTLDRWYNRITACNPRGDFQVNLSPAPEQAASTLQSLVMGNNGQYGALDTGLYWYYAGLQIRTDTWPGP